MKTQYYAVLTNSPFIIYGIGTSVSAAIADAKIYTTPDTDFDSIKDYFGSYLNNADIYYAEISEKLYKYIDDHGGYIESEKIKIVGSIIKMYNEEEEE